MSQSCFSLGFFSQNFLWKLSTICGYKGYLYWCVFGMWKFRFVTNRVIWRLGLATWLSRESEQWANCLARLEILSCSAPAGGTLQLPYMLHTCASFGNLTAVRSNREALLSAHSWVFFTFSYTLPLYESHLNTGFLNAELQTNWYGIKSTKWLIKFNLTDIIDNLILYFIKQRNTYFRF